MKTLFLNPPFHPKFSRGQRSPQVTKSGTLYYPIWLSYAAAAVEKDGHDLKLVDAVADERSVGDLVDIVRSFKPDLIVVDTSTPSIDNDALVAQELKAVSSDAVVGLVRPIFQRLRPKLSMTTPGSTSSPSKSSIRRCVTSPPP